jgi:hypothetical protein
MKQAVLVYIALLGLTLTTAPTWAQGEGPGRSRLELGRRSAAVSSTVPVVAGFRFLRQPVLTGLDRSLTFRANAPVNEYFRTLLMARPVAPAARPVAARPAVTESAATVPAPAESRPSAEETGRTEERLFANDQIVVSNIYPNPANDVAELDYQLTGGSTEARVMLLDVLGLPVADFILDRSDRKLRLNTRDLPTGYYFYQLSLDGRKVATKKLLVRHQ